MGWGPLCPVLVLASPSETKPADWQSAQESQRERAAVPSELFWSRGRMCAEKGITADTEKVRIHGINEAYAAEERR